MSTLQKTKTETGTRDAFLDLSLKCRQAAPAQTADLILEAFDLIVPKISGREAVWEIGRNDLQKALRMGFIEGAAISLLPEGASWTGGVLNGQTTISLVRLASGSSAACRDAASFPLALLAALCRSKSQDWRAGAE